MEERAMTMRDDGPLETAFIMREIHEFVEEKGWNCAAGMRPQTPRNLAASISIEAAELLECFQWSDEGDQAKVESELADVLIYSLRFAQVTGIDPMTAIRKKLAINRRRVWDVKVPKE
jgi:NTP pyrophosphatase (non-canonical NTP hydrolase)